MSATQKRILTIAAVSLATMWAVNKSATLKRLVGG